MPGGWVGKVFKLVGGTGAILGRRGGRLFAWAGRAIFVGNGRVERDGRSFVISGRGRIGERDGRDFRIDGRTNRARFSDLRAGRGRFWDSQAGVLSGFGGLMGRVGRARCGD